MLPIWQLVDLEGKLSNTTNEGAPWSTKLCVWDVASNYELKAEKNTGFLLRNVLSLTDGKTVVSPVRG